VARNLAAVAVLLLWAPAGLPRRPWYKHVLYAPGIYSGY
jgi:hypothetical protein